MSDRQHTNGNLMNENQEDNNMNDIKNDKEKEKENEVKPLNEETKKDYKIKIYKESNKDEEEENMKFGIPTWKLFIYVFIGITVIWMILAIGLGVGLR